MRRRGLIVERREFAKSLCTSLNQLRGELNLLRGILLAQAEADARSCTIGPQPHGGQYVRRLDRPRGAGRAGRDREPLQIKSNDQGFAFDIVEVNVRCVRDTK